MTAHQSWIPYLPLIAAMAAVVLGTIGNTLLEWFRQSFQQSREAKTIKRAFLEEFKIHRKMYAAAIPEEGDKDGSLLVPVDPFFPVYDHLMGKIGLLEPDEASKILSVYGQLILVPKNLSVLGKLHKNEFATFIEVHERYRRVIVNMYSEAIKVLDAGISCLERKKMSPNNG